jgi:undecaprenyl-diphosphatase
MIEFLDHLDQSVFLFLNGLHNPFMDRLIMIATKGAVWIPLYLLFLYLVIRKYKWNTLLIIIVVTLMILVSDQLSDLIKNSVHRLRPSQQPGLRVHIVDAYKGGTFGFYSAHATNSFSVAVFIILILGKYYRYFFIPILLWAILMSYTRIYLGVHYPGDILAGMLAGSLIGYLCGKAAIMMISRLSKKKNNFPPGKDKWKEEKMNPNP